MCDGPPNWCRKMTCLARARSRRASRRPQQGGQVQAGDPRRARLEQAPPREAARHPEVGAFAAHRDHLPAHRIATDRPFAQCRSRNSLLLMIAQATSSQALRRSLALATWSRIGRALDAGRARGRARRGRARRGSLGRSALGLEPLADPVVGGLELPPDRLAVDHLERLGQGRRLRPLALAGQQAVGLAEGLEERAPHGGPGNCVARRRRGCARERSGTPSTWLIASSRTSAGSSRTAARAKFGVVVGVRRVRASRRAGRSATS